MREDVPLYAALLSDTTFHDFLLACDRDLAAQARRGGCRRCRGTVHSGNFRRKPRGRLCGLGPEHDWRFSLCCARHGCRTRKTPASLRFLGPKVYLAAAIILIAVMYEGGAARTRRLKELVGVDRRSLERWRRWWREIFTATPFWQIARASFMPPVEEDRLPATMLERFVGNSLTERMIALLRFLAPITGGQVQVL
jgi:hypothetical protein